MTSLNQGLPKPWKNKPRFYKRRPSDPKPNQNFINLKPQLSIRPMCRDFWLTRWLSASRLIIQSFWGWIGREVVHLSLKPWKLLLQLEIKFRPAFSSWLLSSRELLWWVFHLLAWWITSYMDHLMENQLDGTNYMCYQEQCVSLVKYGFPLLSSLLSWP